MIHGAQLLVDKVVALSFALLLKHTVEHGAPVVVNGIAWFEVGNVAISHAQRKVGIGGLAPVVHFAKAAHIHLVERAAFGSVGSECTVQVVGTVAVKCSHLLVERVVLDKAEVILGQCIGQFGAVGKHRLAVHLVDECTPILAFGHVGRHGIKFVVLDKVRCEQFHLALVNVEVERLDGAQVFAHNALLGRLDVLGLAIFQSLAISIKCMFRHPQTLVGQRNAVE